LDRLPNVPLIHLQTSFIENHKSYLIDALNIPSRIPIIHRRRISCSIDNKKDKLEINFKRIKQILFGNHLKLNQKCPCKQQQQQQHIHFDNKPKQKQSIPFKKHYKRILTKYN